MFAKLLNFIVVGGVMYVNAQSSPDGVSIVVTHARENSLSSMIHTTVKNVSRLYHTRTDGIKFKFYVILNKVWTHILLTAYKLIL